MTDWASSGSNRYQSKVRVGNWFEETCIQKDQIRTIRKLHHQGQLVSEKVRSLYENFNNEVSLDAPNKFVCYGSVVQLMPFNMNLSDVNTTELNPALSVVVNDTVLRYNQTVNEDCDITVAASPFPCMRNSFRIVSCDGKDRTNEILKYGQRFRLEAAMKSDDPLCLYTMPKQQNLDHPIKTKVLSHWHGEENLPLGLVRYSNCGVGKDIKLAFTEWFCLHKYPLMRFDSHGEPVPSNMPLVIVHASTNRNLAVENVAIQTLFGSEFLVSAQTHRNAAKHITWKNIWFISNGL